MAHARRNRHDGRTQETLNRQLTMPPLSQSGPVFFSLSNRQFVIIQRVRRSHRQESPSNPVPQVHDHRRISNQDQSIRDSFPTPHSGPLSYVSESCLSNSDQDRGPYAVPANAHICLPDYIAHSPHRQGSFGGAGEGAAELARRVEEQSSDVEENT